MTRYYPGQRPPSRNQTHSVKQGLWVVGAFVSGYLMSMLIDVATFNQYFHTYVMGWYEQKMQTTSVVQASEPIVTPKPKLEFYTLLTKESAVVPMPVRPEPTPDKTAVQEAVAVPPSPAANEQYTVQLAALANRQDAEQMQASLLLKGLKVEIMAAEQNHRQWYRVMLGPFSSKSEAESAMQMVAKRERINGMIRKA